MGDVADTAVGSETPVPPDECRVAPRMAVALDEYQGRLRRTREWMRSQHVELLLLTQPEHYNWLSGYEPTSAFYFQALIVPVREDAPLTLLCNKAELLLYEETCWVSDVRVVWTHQDQVASLMGVLRELELDGARRIGVNLSSYHLQARYALGLTRALPHAEIVDVCGALDDLRLIKSPAEIALLRRAAHVADLGVTAGIDAIRAGVDDRKVMAAIQEAVSLAG